MFSKIIEYSDFKKCLLLWKFILLQLLLFLVNKQVFRLCLLRQNPKKYDYFNILDITFDYYYYYRTFLTVINLKFIKMLLRLNFHKLMNYYNLKNINLFLKKQCSFRQINDNYIDNSVCALINI